jgi:imidazolonepropionase-like amidohydrolase
MPRTAFVLLLILAGCQGETPAPESAMPEQAPSPGEGAVAYVDANIWDGTGSAVRTDEVLVVRDGRIVGLYKNVPEGAEMVSLRNRWVVPGLINTHGHVSGRWADDGVEDTADRVRGDLALYARYGITTVLSLGGAPDEAVAVRDAQQSERLDHARVHIAGQVVGADTPSIAESTVNENLDLGVDWIKLRIDDNLGRTPKMPWDAVEAAIAAARTANVPVATHIFYMDDAARLLDTGTSLIAHSVRDRAVSDDFVAKLRDSGVCYVPTLVREVSVFVYADRPDWFDDPFFLEGAKMSEVERLSQPDFMARVAEGPAQDGYQQALVQAQANLQVLLDAGVPIAFGTDSGPGGRFPGYFEHLEMDLMTEAGLSAGEILLSATSVAARCIGLDDVGTLEPGNRADFVVLDENPLEDIRAMRTIEAVYIAGNEVDR